MKKLMMMAMMFVASATAFAGDSDALKAVMRAKTYAETAELLKANLDQMADNAEKAKAYNKLVDLAMNAVNKEWGVAIENKAKIQMGGKVEAFDTLALCDNLILAIEAANECNKYDQLPDAKDRVKPKFEQKNALRLWAPREILLIAGDEFRVKNDLDNCLKYWSPWLDTFNSPLFDKMESIDAQRTLAKEQFEQVAYLAAHIAYQKKDVNLVNKYAEIAKMNEKFKADAYRFQFGVMQETMKTKEDTLQFVNQLKQMYAAEPENDIVFETLNGYYERIKDKVAQASLLDQHLAKYPNSFVALANKGLMAVNDNNAEEGAKWLRKASEAKPDNAVIWTYLGACLSVLAANATDNATATKNYDEAIAAFDKAKELDPNKEQANWGYNRYQAYYGRYGADDPKTKQAEADK